MQLQLIEYACPECNKGFAIVPERAGTEDTCNHCKTTFTIPTGQPIRLLRDGVLVPQERGFEVAAGAASGGAVPIEMSLPKGLGSFKAPVTQGTADRMAGTFLGGLLMASGVVIASMLGLRKRS